MGKKILLADDSITIQKVIELTFSDEDFDVITVGNGRLALERFPEVRPDIVLCDILMPEKDGYEVCEQIKANPAWSHVPVLLLTGAFEPFDQERAARAGFDGSLAKPFEPETLIAKVKELLARAPRTASVTPTSQPPRPVPPPPAASVMPFSRAAAVEVPPPAPDFTGGVGFIPEEPFTSFEEEPFEPAPAVPVAPAPQATGFASLSDEESTTLGSAEPPEVEDSASTVMFQASDLPWAVAAAAVAKPAPPATAASSPAPEPEPLLVPEGPPEEPEVVEEQAVFEAVLEEDLDFGPNDYAPEPEAAHEAAMAAEFGGGIATLPPLPPSDLDGPTGQFAALVGGDLRPAVDPAAFGPGSVPRDEVVFEVEPERAPAPVAETAAAPLPDAVPVFEHEASLQEPEVEVELEPEPDTLAPHSAFDARTPPPGPVLEAASPVPAAEVASWPLEAIESTPGPAEAVEPIELAHEAVAAVSASASDERTRLMARPVFDEPALETVPIAPAPEPVTSFADVLPPHQEPPAVAPSETAAVAVPVEMVEKIAQRVVAQISEKAVREIAWDVIPDLAEALIRQEIERLKAELAKL